MDQQQILNATITIEEVVDKEKKIVLKAHDGNRVFTYSIWKTKQDGSDTSAYSQFKSMGLRSGSAVMIGYVIDEYTTQIGGFDKKVQSKKIINLRESEFQPSQTAPQGKSSNGGANRGQSGHFKDETFWEKQAYEKCCSLWAASVIEKHNDAVAIKAIESGDFWRLFQAIKADGAKRFSEAIKPTNLEPDLPVIQQDEDVNVEDIPF